MSSRPSRGTARLAAILDALPDGLLLVNCNGTVVNANAIALEMFETPGTALVGRGLLDLLPEFDSKLIPGSMRRPDAADEQGRTKPTRMIARRTDRHEYPVEVTSASLDSGQAAYNDIHSSYTGDELLMIVVRDLSGTVDTEAELARSQRQTEMILRAASEGVVGTDTDGRVVLVNPAAAQILGFRASDLGGQELHPLILHSRAEGEPFPYEESPLADTLKSGRKHRVRGQVLWSKSGAQVPVDLTTAPVRDGDQLVGAVMTFTDRRPYEELSAQHKTVVAELTKSHSDEVTALKEAHAAELKALKEAHTAELADRAERYTAELEEQAERLASLGAQHSQLTAVLGGSLRGPLEELRGELSTLAADPAGQLWPEANQILHHLAAGYARMTTLVDNVLGYQRLDAGVEGLHKAPALVDGIVTGGIDGAVELIGPGRAQFAVHAPPIEAEVDARQLATALAHLVADVCGVDSTGKTRAVPGGGYVDSTVVVAAAQRGDAVRIEVRGPFAGGDPVHQPIVRGIVQAHGGVLQTHEMPGMSGSAYVLDIPIGAGAGTIVPPEAPVDVPADPSLASPAPPAEAVGAPGVTSGGRRRARRSSTDAFLDAPGAPEAEAPVAAEGPADGPVAEPTGRRRARRGPAAPEEQAAPELIPAQQGEGSGRRRGRPSPAEAGAVGAGTAGAGTAENDAAENGPAGGSRGGSGGGPLAIGAAQGGPVEGAASDGERGAAALQQAHSQAPQPQRQALALTSAAPSAPSEGSVVTAAEGAQGAGRPQRGQTVPPQGVPADPQQPVPPAGRRARREGGDHRPALPALAAGSSSGGTGVGTGQGQEQARASRASRRVRTSPRPTRTPRHRTHRRSPRPSSPVGVGPAGRWPPPRSAPPPRPVRVPPSPCRPPTRTGHRRPRAPPPYPYRRRAPPPYRRPATTATTSAPRPRPVTRPRRPTPWPRTRPTTPTGPSTAYHRPVQALLTRPARRKRLHRHTRLCPARPPRLLATTSSPGGTPCRRLPPPRRRRTAPVPHRTTGPGAATGRPPTPPEPPPPAPLRTRPTRALVLRCRARGGSRCPPRSRCRASTLTPPRDGRSACGRWARACPSPSTSRSSTSPPPSPPSLPRRSRASGVPVGGVSSPPRRRASAPRPSRPPRHRPRPRSPLPPLRARPARSTPRPPPRKPRRPRRRCPAPASCWRPPSPRGARTP
ncbi:PAS domain-containing protein [Streptomyces sp. CBG31]|uniref:PAS domain-containing protein n=1 Tax=Streptomyces sp. CBG31 TaxID=2762623 RepID=UPI0037D9C755